MEWLSGFTITVLCVVLLTSVMNALMPDGNLSKFINMVLGMVVMVTIIGSAIGLTKLDFDKVFAVDAARDFNRENAAEAYNRQIAQNFEARLAEEIAVFIKTNYGIDASVSAKAAVDANNNVTGVQSIAVRVPVWADAVTIRKDLAKVYGVSTKDITVGGGE